MIEAIRYFHASSLGELEQMMPALIAAGWQPFDQVVIERSADGWDFTQVMTKGAANSLPANQVIIANGNTSQLYAADGTASQGVTVNAVIVNGVLLRQQLPASVTTISNGDTVSVRNSAGANAKSGTAVVSSSGSLTGINLPATTAMIDNSAAVTVQNSAGTAIAGTHAATVAAGAISNIKLAANIAPIANGTVLSSLPVTNNAILAIGTVNRSVTITVANGVITGITVV
ncbi:hypothetical protein [Pectobacterium sp. 21LCBS03]|uniref:hypothetical protein n=1 Tax=Pectobacterium sp. 21LCBS03 TaxID=2935858 RepID=UPI00200C518B|nr:hypothetical protein [Pectobacterium sp. 21LCBS03]UPY96256.1 hypothetical protein MYB54_05990 [Pectobacterium sp. 21LCBS03]